MRHVRTWKLDDFRVQLFDTGREDRRGNGRPELAYKLFHKGTLIFEGEEFCPSPMVRPGSNRAIADLLGFLYASLLEES